MSEHEEADDIRERIEELEIMLFLLQQTIEALELFQRLPPKKETPE